MRQGLRVQMPQSQQLHQDQRHLSKPAMSVTASASGKANTKNTTPFLAQSLIIECIVLWRWLCTRAIHRAEDAHLHKCLTRHQADVEGDQTVLLICRIHEDSPVMSTADYYWSRIPSPRNVNWWRKCHSMPCFCLEFRHPSGNLLIWRQFEL